MLYSFHKDRNGKRPGSVHATYQIIGRRPSLRYSTNGAAQEDEDVEMEGNPFQSSMPETQEEEEETIQVTGFVLVQEEELEGMHYKTDELLQEWIWTYTPQLRKRHLTRLRRYSYIASSRVIFRIYNFYRHAMQTYDGNRETKTHSSHGRSTAGFVIPTARYVLL